MPTFVYMTRCDGCGHCVDICPSDIMHIDKTYRRAYNIEPSMCWECYSCVKACPQNAIDMRGYADFAPLGHSVRVQRDEQKGTIAWKIKFRNGTEKKKERVRRQTRMVELINKGRLPYTPSIMSWISAQLDKPTKQITQEDIDRLLDSLKP